jgi:hypothetical protein
MKGRELLINPLAPLCDPKAAEALARKREQLFDGDWRPKNRTYISSWPRRKRKKKITGKAPPP